MMALFGRQGETVEGVGELSCIGGDFFSSLGGGSVLRACLCARRANIPPSAFRCWPFLYLFVV